MQSLTSKPPLTVICSRRCAQLPSSPPPRQDGLPDWLQPQVGTTVSPAVTATDKSDSGGGTSGSAIDGADGGLDWLQALAKPTVSTATPAGDASPPPPPTASVATENVGVADAESGATDWLAAAMRGNIPPAAAAKPAAAVPVSSAGVAEGGQSSRSLFLLILNTKLFCV